MASVTTVERGAPSSPTTRSGSIRSSPRSSPRQARRESARDIQAANHLFQRASRHRLSARTTNSNQDLSLDLTLSSAATVSSCFTSTSGEGYHNSFTINSRDNDSTSSIGNSLGTHSSRWGNYSVKFRAKSFVHRRLSPLESLYEVGELLGQGSYGEVYRCWRLDTGHERAVKVIPKDELQQTEEEVIKEFNILKECDHPNLLKVYECLEDSNNFYIVSEIIKGGELYDDLDRCGNLSEEDTKVLMNVLLRCINYCHQRGLVHRDLKPENILLEQNKDYHQLKIIDFGLAQQVPKLDGSSQQFALTDIEGSKYYMSPQVLQGHYSAKCDVWSLGVIAFIMLGGYAPFDGATDDEIHQAILDGHFDFDYEVWDFVSDEAKEFISALLTYDEQTRPTAEEILKHPWLQAMPDVSSHTDRRWRASTRATLNDLQSFHTADSKLKQATCAIIASQLLSREETEGIDRIFRSLDVSCSGRLSLDDLKRSFQDYCQGDGVSDDELDELLKQVNYSGSGAIEYSEFIIATMMEKNLIDDEKLRAAFSFFDKEGKGYISPENLKEVLQIDDSVRGGDAYVTKKIIAQVDADGNGLIDFDEFKNMMFSRSLKRLSVRRSSRCQRLSLNKQQMLQYLDEALDEDQEEEESSAKSFAEEKRIRGGLSFSPTNSPPVSRSGSTRPLLGQTVMEESEEYYNNDSETEEDELFPEQDEEEEVPTEDMMNSAVTGTQLATMGKRRKARSFCGKDQDPTLVLSSEGSE